MFHRDLLQHFDPSELPLLDKLLCLAQHLVYLVILSAGLSVEVKHGVNFVVAIERLENCLADCQLLPAPPLLVVSYLFLLMLLLEDVLLRSLVCKDKFISVDREAFCLVEGGITRVLVSHEDRQAEEGYHDYHESVILEHLAEQITKVARLRVELRGEV